MPTTSNHDIQRNTKYEIRNSIFSFFWRLTILILPLQTRWFADASLAGWAFEQGRLSFYISWIPLIITVILGFFLPKTDLPKKIRVNLFWLIALIAAINIASTPLDIRATSMWWIQILLLLSFFITLLRAGTKLDSVLAWFIVSLVPHAIFALIQVWIQHVPGWSWIGVAIQDPKNLGVSVVQTGDLRFLRAYGGFSHPNILGGFMAYGILIAGWLFLHADELRNKWIELSILSAIPLFTVALFYSFSRSAWLALAVGFFTLLILSAINRAKEKIDPLKIMIFSIAVIVSFATFAFINQDYLMSRVGMAFESSRLEQQSTLARTNSIKNGIRVFQAYPIFGTGPNSELPAFSAMESPLVKGGDLTQSVKTGDSRPLEPPHNVFILILANFGAAGSLIIFGFLLFLLRQILNRWKTGSLPYRVLLSALLVSWLTISLFDHYLYTLWSGQILSVLTMFIILGWLVKKSTA
jgi:O-antigen ligase